MTAYHFFSATCYQPTQEIFIINWSVSWHLISTKNMLFFCLFRTLSDLNLHFYSISLIYSLLPYFLRHLTVIYRSGGSPPNYIVNYGRISLSLVDFKCLPRANNMTQISTTWCFESNEPSVAFNNLSNHSTNLV